MVMVNQPKDKCANFSSLYGECQRGGLAAGARRACFWATFDTEP